MENPILTTVVQLINQLHSDDRTPTVEVETNPAILSQWDITSPDFLVYLTYQPDEYNPGVEVTYLISPDEPISAMVTYMDTRVLSFSNLSK